MQLDRRPNFQTGFIIAVAVLAGFVGAGTLVDALNNAVSFITQRRAVVVSCAVLAAWVGLFVIGRTIGIPWRFSAGPVLRVRSPGIAINGTLAGLLAFLWIPLLWREELQPNSGLSDRRGNFAASSVELAHDSTTSATPRTHGATGDLNDGQSEDFESSDVDVSDLPEHGTPEVTAIYKIPLTGRGLDCSALIPEAKKSGYSPVAVFRTSGSPDTLCNPSLGQFLVSEDYLGYIGGTYYQLRSNHCISDYLNGRRPAYVGGAGAVFRLECSNPPSMKSRLGIKVFKPREIQCSKPQRFFIEAHEEGGWGAFFSKTSNRANFNGIDITIEDFPFAKGTTHIIHIGNQELLITETEQNFDSGCSDFPSFVVMHDNNCKPGDDPDLDVVERLVSKLPTLIKVDGHIVDPARDDYDDEFDARIELTISECALPK